MNEISKLALRILFKIERIYLFKKNEQSKLLFKHCGIGVKIDSNCHIVVPQQLEVGDNTSIACFTTIFATFGVKIGNNCFISSNCGISSVNHIKDSPNRFIDDLENIKYSKEVIIGNNVWIGMNACILPGINIGNNSIIGAGSVVTKDIPSNEIWVGNPARFIKKVNL